MVLAVDCVPTRLGSQGCTHYERGDAVELARGWKDSPQVAACLEAEITRSAAAAGTTSDSAWAGPLAAYGIAAEALQLLRGASVIGALESKMRKVPFRAKVAREIGAGTGGAWIGEGFSTPVAATNYDTLYQEIYKAGEIVVLSQELLRASDPAAERTVTDTVVAGVAAYLDAQFLTPSVALIPNLQPASITHGATAITSSGTSAAQIAGDLAAMLAAIQTPGSGLTWVMRKKTMGTIAAALGSTSGLPATLLAMPVLTSDNAGAQITLIDCAAVLYSDDGQIALDTSEEALLAMDSAPMNPPDATVVQTSLWQNDQWGARAVRWIAYQVARPGAVSYMTVAY